MKPQHTPGPWHIDTRFNTTRSEYAGNIGIIAEQCSPVAVIPENARQNAILIAKSPEMHDLLKECEHAMNQIPLKHYNANGERTDTYKLAAKIGKLLQK